jgi:hypothetical protein
MTEIEFCQLRIKIEQFVDGFETLDPERPLCLPKEAIMDWFDQTWKAHKTNGTADALTVDGLTEELQRKFSFRTN